MNPSLATEFPIYENIYTGMEIYIHTNEYRIS